MERRKFIIGAGSLAADSAAAVGTGAFTSVSADRAVSVAVAPDASALLAIRASDGSNGAYADVTSSDTLEVDISGDNPTGAGGSGVNQNATTVIESVFEIENQGTNEVEVDLNTSSDDIRVGDPPADPDDGVWVYFDDDETPAPQNNNPALDAQRFDGGTDAEIQVGEAIDVDLTVVTENTDPNQFSGSLTIEADGEDAGPSDPSNNGEPN